MKVSHSLRLSFVALVAVVQTVAAQQSDYYQSVQGLKKAELKTALFKLIQPVYVPSYGGKGEGYTWWGFTKTDKMPDGSVRDRYSDNRYEFNGLNAVSGMNIEHSFANSWWGHTVNNAYRDMYNLFPSDGEANGRKSNNPIGVVDGNVAYDNGVTRVGRSTSYSVDSLITVWEPADRWKGDFARTYFYMATCYEDYVDAWQTTEGLLMVEKNRYPTLRPWVTRLLLRWNASDPVDEIETERNQAVQRIQGNRNPFVDYPQLADYIWGDSVDYRFYTSQDDVPVLFVPAKDEVIDYGLHSLARGFNGSFIVRGRGAADNVTLSVSNPNFVLGKTTITQDEFIDGVSIPVVCCPAYATHETATLFISGGGIDRQCAIVVDFVDGLPAYEAKNVTCSVNSKKFTASWMKWSEGETYTLDVCTADGKSVSGYPIVVTDTFAVVSNLKAAATYRYKVTTSGGVASNVITVEMPDVLPVFTSNTASMFFTATPGANSRPQLITVTAIEVKKYETQVEVSTPFEVSANGETWSTNTTLTGSSQTLYVRLGAIADEEIVEGELILSTEGVPEIVVALKGDVDTKKAFFETFETGSKNSYTEAVITAAAASWNLNNALIGSIADDSKNDMRGVRIIVKSSAANEVTMQEDFAYGCDSLWFYAGPYNKDTGMKLSVYYSTDRGVTWKPIDGNLALPNASWQRYGYKLGVSSPLRLKFVGGGTNSKRINIDDIQMSACMLETGNERILARQNADDIVSVYTYGGMRLRTGRRASVTRSLPPGLYIIK